MGKKNQTQKARGKVTGGVEKKELGKNITELD